MSPPVASEVEEQIIVRERLRLLALGYYVKGAVGAVFISFLLLHFCMFLGFSFIPESSWNAPSKSATTAQSPSVQPSPAPRASQGPPVIVFRIFAAVIGVIILLGWTFGALTIYAGRCVQKRQHRLFIYVMAGLNCALIPWGTLLGICHIHPPAITSGPGSVLSRQECSGRRRKLTFRWIERSVARCLFRAAMPRIISSLSDGALDDLVSARHFLIWS